jgi:hypothetical protein
MELLRDVSAANNFVLAIVPIIFAAFLVVRSQPASRRRRQQRLLRCVSTERGGVQAIGRAAAAAETSHHLEQ